MYQQFYNLAAMPFENTPDPRFFYASEQHREALAAIEYTIRLRKGFVLVTGDIGSGKTTVGRTMCERLSDRAQIVSVLHGHRDSDGVVRQLLRALNIRSRRGDDHGRMLERVQQYLLAQLNDGRPVVLFVDEAQTLSDEALEELRLLSNFDTSTAKPVQVVLIGQPELRQRIRNPKLNALRQRIVMAKQLRAMSASETPAYIHHRLAAASVDPKHVQVSFSEQATREVHNFTRGIPRLINVACDNCLLLGMVRETREVTPAMVRRVVEDMIPSFNDPTPIEEDRPPLSLAGNF
ncbi:MAG: AAA family ATPase [Phycisphaera sp.]|nr:AAA family ATPase [Phycisphaera sp.]